MSLQNPKTINEVIEKLMISCITAVLEQQRDMTNAYGLEDIEKASKKYGDYLLLIKKKSIKLIKEITKRGK